MPLSTHFDKGLGENVLCASIHTHTHHSSRLSAITVCLVISLKKDTWIEAKDKRYMQKVFTSIETSTRSSAQISVLASTRTQRRSTKKEKRNSITHYLLTDIFTVTLFEKMEIRHDIMYVCFDKMCCLACVLHSLRPFLIMNGRQKKDNVIEVKQNQCATMVNIWWRCLSSAMGQSCDKAIFIAL